MAQPTLKNETVEFEILRDEVDGWDVRKADEEQALSNHASLAEAEEAARLRGAEEEAVDFHVTVNDRDVHGIDDDSRGMSTMLLSLVGLLAFVTFLLAALSLAGSLTGFGAGWS